VTKHRRHKKILAQTKGQRNSRSRMYKRAHESTLHAMTYAYRHRRERKRDFRSLWIMRIGAAARALGLTYSQLMNGLKKAEVQLDRKSLAELAAREPESFAKLVETAKAAL
jgi:large subunit ribosomal protein L20